MQITAAKGCVVLCYAAEWRGIAGHLRPQESPERRDVRVFSLFYRGCSSSLLHFMFLFIQQKKAVTSSLPLSAIFWPRSRS